MSDVLSAEDGVFKCEHSLLTGIGHVQCHLWPLLYLYLCLVDGHKCRLIYILPILPPYIAVWCQSNPHTRP